MPVRVYIPTPYRDATGGLAEVRAEGGRVSEVLSFLTERYPGLGEKVFVDGKIPEYLSIYVGADEIRDRDGLETPVGPDEELALIPAMAGGAGLLSEAQLDRYSRQVILPEVGVVGQRRLLDAKVVIVGTGGLGSPAAMYLAAAGVGTIGLVDGDRVEASNLHRQPIHGERDVGRPKTLSAARFIEDLNADVQVVRHDTWLTSENALEILAPYDVIVNGSDNFPARYLVNDAAYLLGKPLVDASILRFEGQATVFVPGEGCYRCLFPHPPAPGSVPSCAEGGVIGALAGQMGTLQAMEALKILLGIGKTLAGKLYVYDALSGRSRTLNWRRRTTCPLCGDHPSLTELIDYEAFCGIDGSRRGADLLSATEDGQIPSDEAARRLGTGDALFVDLRTEGEFCRGTIPGSVSLPFERLETELPNLAAGRPLVFFCEMGQKSKLATLAAAEMGLAALSLKGGLVSWRNAGLPLEAGK